MLDELLKASVTGVGTLLVGWVLLGVRDRRREVRARRESEEFVNGLPGELKAVLASFHDEHAHTARRNPSDPAVNQLLRMGVLHLGGGGGTYDAVNSYVTVAPAYRPHLWLAAADELIAQAREPHDQRGEGAGEP